MANKSVPKLYSVSIEFSTTEQDRLKRHVNAMGYSTIREFIRLSILEKIHSDINSLSPEDRRAVETVMKRQVTHDLV